MQTTNDLRNIFTEVANAIREKTGKTNSLSPYGFAEEILSIQQGGSSTSENTLKALLDYTQSCRNMFHYNEDISDLRNYIGPNDTENVTNMDYMFSYCSNLEYVPRINTKSVNSCNDMFSGCYTLKRVDLSHLISGDVMFYSCHSLKDIIIRNYRYETFWEDSFSGCYHFDGTQDDEYNPDGLKDGRIYVPSSEIDNFKQIIRDSYNTGIALDADMVLRPIYSVAIPENGEISQITNENNETILTAIPNTDCSFTGWYNGEYIMPDNIGGQTINGESPDDEEYPWHYDDEFEMYVNGNQNASGTVSCIRFNFTVTESDQRLKITYYQEVEEDPNFGCIGNIDEEFNHYYTQGDQLYGVSMSDIDNEREVAYRDNMSLGDHFIDIKFAHNMPNSSPAIFMVKVELVSAGGSKTLMGELYSTSPEINVGVIDEQTMDPLNLIAVFEGETPVEPDPDEPVEPDIPDEPEDPDEPYEPDVSGPPEIRISTSGSPNAYYGISYSTDKGQSWQSFPRYTFDDFDAAEDGYIVALENINQIKFRVEPWYSLECEELGIYIYNEDEQYEDSENCVLDGPATLYAEQLD